MNWSLQVLAAAASVFFIVATYGNLSERAYTFDAKEAKAVCIVNIELGMQAMSCIPKQQAEGGSDMKKRVTQVTLVPEGEPIFSDMAYTVTIDDEAAGEFVVVRSLDERAEAGAIAIEAAEWPALRDAIDEMFCEIKRGAGDE